MSIIKRVPIILLVLGFLLVGVSNKGSATVWWLGNHLYDVYGGWARIYTPPSSPYTPLINDYGQANWVGTPGPDWVQAGWTVDVQNGTLDTQPWAYVEFCFQECNVYRFYREYENQPWGTVMDYMISNEPDYYPSNWCAYTNNIRRECFIIRVAPSRIDFDSELDQSSQIGLHTLFSEIYFKDSNGIWSLSNQSNYWASPIGPYKINAYSSYSFLNYRESKIFIPIAIK